MEAWKSMVQALLFAFAFASCCLCAQEEADPAEPACDLHAEQQLRVHVLDVAIDVRRRGVWFVRAIDGWTHEQVRDEKGTTYVEKGGRAESTGALPYRSRSMRTRP